jgi:hypothetical protein
MTTSKQLLGPTKLWSKAVGAYKQNLSTLIPWMILPAVLDFAANFATRESGNEFTPVAIIASVISGIAYLVLTGAISYLVSGLKANESLKKGINKFWSLLWVSILSGLMVLGGFILLVIPGIIFSIWVSQAIFVVLFEDKTGTKAIRRSKALVKGLFWPVFGRLLFTLLPALGLMVIGAIGLPGVIVSSLILSLALMPILFAYEYFLYKDLAG